MGIFRFYSQFLRKIGDGVVVTSLPSSLGGGGEIRVEGVIFDLNGMLHSIAQKVFMYGKAYEEAKKGGEASLEAFKIKKEEESKKKFSELMDVYAETLSNELNQILTVLSPKQYVIIAVDGMAPDAKVQQQRNRRYKGFIDSSSSPSDGGEDKSIGLPIGGFDSALISPGTSFMIEVDTFVRAWLTTSMNNRKEWIKQHNISARRRKGESDSQKQSRMPRGILPAVVVYSSHLVHGEGEHKAFHTMREMMKEGSLFQGTGCHIVYGADADLSMLSLVSPFRNIYLSRENLRQYICIEELYNEIRRRMTNDEKAGNSVFDRETICRDFVVMSNLIGNDFLPHSPAFQSMGASILSSYAEIETPLTFLNADGTPEIILSSIGNLFYSLARREPSLLEEHAQKELNDVGTQYQRVKPSKVLLSAYDRRTRKIDMNFFRANHYAEAARIRNKTLLLSSKEASFTNTSSVMRRMVCDYVATFGWMLRYYVSGASTINWKHAYKFISAPLANDIAHVIVQEFMKMMDGGPPSSSVQQRTTSPSSRKRRPTSPSPSSRKTTFSSILTANDLYEHSCVLAKDKGNYGFTEKTGDPRTRGHSAINLATQLLIITPPPTFKKVFTSAPDLVSLAYDTPALTRFMMDEPSEIEIYLDGMRAKYEGIAILPDVDPLEIVETLKTLETGYREVKVGESKQKKEIKEAEGFGPAIDKFGRPRVETHRVKALIPARLSTFASEEPIVFKPSGATLEIMQKAVGFKPSSSEEPFGDKDEIPKQQILVSEFSETAAVGGNVDGGRWGDWDYETEAKEEEEEERKRTTKKGVISVSSPRKKISPSSPKPLLPAPVASFFPELSKLEEFVVSTGAKKQPAKTRKPRAKKAVSSVENEVEPSSAPKRKPRAKKTA